MIPISATTDTGSQTWFTSLALPAAGNVGVADPSTIKYQWFSFPNGGDPAGSPSFTTPTTLNWCYKTPMYKSQLTCDYNLIKDYWDDAMYAEFTPTSGARLDSVEIAITGGEDVYLSVMVRDSAGKIITDNDGYGGGKECYLTGTNCSAKSVDANGYSWRKFIFQIRPWLDGGETYQIYARKRGVSQLKWYKNACVPNVSGCVYINKGYLYKTHLLSTPSGDGTFSNFYGDGGLMGISSWTPPAMVTPGQTYSIVAQVVDGSSYKLGVGDFGGGICPIGTVTITTPTPSPISTPTPTPVASAWFQTQDINVYSRGNLDSKVPVGALPAPAYFAKDGLGGFPGTVVYKGAEQPDFVTNERISSTNWLANTNTRNIKMDYQYLLNRLKVDLSAPVTVPIAEPAESGTYYYEAGQIINDDWEIGEGVTVVVFIAGDLTVMKDIEVDEGGFLAIIVSGDINFSPEAKKAQGFFSADGEIIVEPGSNQFEGQGSFIGWSGFQLLRDFADARNLTTPSELFSSRPDLWINVPDLFKFSAISREELMP